MLPALPDWIHKRDGRLAPFEADKISQSLFAASESLHQPDAFTARELTDSILHFLAADLNGAIPNTTQVADVVAKVIRELGQAPLAQAYTNFRKRRTSEAGVKKAAPREQSPAESAGTFLSKLPPPEILAQYQPASLIRTAADFCLREYSLREILTRDIAAAHEEGLITLTGLETPFEISGAVLAPVGQAFLPAEVLGFPKPVQQTLLSALEAFRKIVGQFAVLDSPEFAQPSPSASTSQDWVRHLLLGLETTGLSGVVNLNCSAPPSWSQSLAAGPLFAESRASIPARDTWTADELVNHFHSHPNPPVQIHWHLGERDFLQQAKSRIDNLARLILEAAPITVVFDRPGRPILLAEGLDRKHGELLLAVGLHLPALAQHASVQSSPDRFLHKLRSLTRLALTAAVQKRRFLTRYRPRLPAFLIDRARLLVVPVGLEAVTRLFTGQGILPLSPGADFACKIVRSLHEILQEEGPLHNLSACVDAPPICHRRHREHGDSVSPVLSLALNFPQAINAESEPESSQIAGLTAWNQTIPPTEQAQAASSLHAATQTGTAFVQLPKDQSTDVEKLVGILRFAWKETALARLQFVNPQPPGRQLTAPWEGQ
jgi:hypothetical protein